MKATAKIFEKHLGGQAMCLRAGFLQGILQQLFMMSWEWSPRCDGGPRIMAMPGTQDARQEKLQAPGGDGQWGTGGGICATDYKTTEEGFAMIFKTCTWCYMDWVADTKLCDSVPSRIGFVGLLSSLAIFQSPIFRIRMLFFFPVTFYNVNIKLSFWKKVLRGTKSFPSGLRSDFEIWATALHWRRQSYSESSIWTGFLLFYGMAMKP